MARYGKKAAAKVAKALHERKRGTLRSGSTGEAVKSRKQAIAIGLSEARRAGGKVPKKKAPARKAVAKKRVARKRPAAAKSKTRKANPRAIRRAPAKKSPRKSTRKKK